MSAGPSEPLRLTATEIFILSLFSAVNIFLVLPAEAGLLWTAVQPHGDRIALWMSIYVFVTALAALATAIGATIIAWRYRRTDIREAMLIALIPVGALLIQGAIGAVAGVYGALVALRFLMS